MMNDLLEKNPLEDPETFKREMEELMKPEISDNLNTILKSQERIREAKSKRIKFTPAILKLEDDPVLFPHTINVIQGQAGVHKSRLAEVMCSAMMKRQSCQQQLLRFKRNNMNSTHTIVYVDTERNQTEQFPAALQSIQVNAGYERSEHPYDLEYVSLLEVKREERFPALDEYLNYLKSKTDRPLLVVLDVTTDCIEDFNATKSSMELIDMMNVLINKHNVVFLCLIHENPSSSKARGHLGTELMNKASTVIQVGFEKDGNNQDTDIIRAKFLKCRSTRRLEPLYMKYCNETHGLVRADVSEVTEVVDRRKRKAPVKDVIDHLEMYLGDGKEIKRNDLLKNLVEDFACGQRVIEDRLKEIIDTEAELYNDNGDRSQACRLTKQVREKVVYYWFEPIVLD